MSRFVTPFEENEGVSRAGFNQRIEEINSVTPAQIGAAAGGTDGSAQTAEKLKTARTIGISGGATGTATSFDGSGDIAIPVTALDVSKATAGTLPVARGGTGATTAAAALTSLGATPRSTLTSFTLTAAGWTGSAAPYSQTVSITGVTATSRNTICPALTITAVQLEALQSANLVDGGQTAGKITLKAFGDKPTINIPMRIIIGRDL